MGERPALLVAEDDPSLREVLIDLLRQDGVVADGAEDGTAALARIEERHYDLVLADVDMPGVDGVELLERMQRRRPAIPVILMTGLPSKDRIRSVLARGASDCLSKPFSRAALRDAVQRALASGPPPASH